MSPKKPSKQRKAMAQAPLHKKHKLLSAHLSKELRASLKIRSLPIRKGDEVKVMRGKFKGTTGKVSRVSMKKMKVYIDNIKRKKVSGEEVMIPLQASKLLILNAVMDDSKRRKTKA